MKTSLKVLLATVLVTSLNACAVYPPGIYAGGYHGGPRVMVSPPPIVIGPAPVLVRPGWGWGGRWSGGYHHHGHHGHHRY